MIEVLSQLFIRELKKLKVEMSAYSNESNIWVLNGDIKNTAGNLALHLIGNLNHFVGHVICKTDYKRNRPAEFDLKDVPVSQMNSDIDLTIQMIETEFSQIDETRLNETFPIEVFGYPTTTGFMLTHLVSHLSYHLGQINYHRRLIDA